MAKALPRPLSGNMLKWIAAVCMVSDHVGYLFFPQYPLFRIVGRLSFPIFSFMIAEGCRHTKSKRRYFLGIFTLAVVCQIANYLFSQSLYMCVLVTFSLAIAVICAMQHAKDTFFCAAATTAAKVFSLLLLAASIAFVGLVNTLLTVDYGFWGCMLPVLTLIPFPPRGGNAPTWWRAPDGPLIPVLFLGAGLLILAAERGGTQFYSLAALVLLLLYSGKRGSGKMKHFFYVFYPAHLVLLYGIFLLVR